MESISNRYGISEGFSPPKNLNLWEKTIIATKNTIKFIATYEEKIAIYLVSFITFFLIYLILIKFDETFYFLTRFNFLTVCCGLIVASLICTYLLLLSNTRSINFKNKVYYQGFNKISLKKLKGIQLVGYWERTFREGGQWTFSRGPDHLYFSVFLITQDQRIHLSFHQSSKKSFYFAENISKILSTNFIYLKSDITLLKRNNWFIDGLVTRDPVI
ncbi:MAG: hypothetical protein AB8G05_06190 [Oligoflexales bacterium]